MIHSDQLSNVVDREMALERLDGDIELYDEILVVFRSSTPIEFDRLSDSLNTASLDSAARELAQRHSHSIKSASLSIGANVAAACALAVETSAKSAPPEVLSAKSAELGLALQAVYVWIDHQKKAADA
ncbi:MAG: Hpt domain-containing protein [Deltaproteobacteria bacterium]|nr:Hpt domain-containing protein [Deltaproteobacteria bacterium]